MKTFEEFLKIKEGLFYTDGAPRKKKNQPLGPNDWHTGGGGGAGIVPVGGGGASPGAGAKKMKKKMKKK